MKKKNKGDQKVDHFLELMTIKISNDVLTVGKRLQEDLIIEHDSRFVPGMIGLFHSIMHSVIDDSFSAAMAAFNTSWMEMKAKGEKESTEGGKDCIHRH